LQLIRCACASSVKKDKTGQGREKVKVEREGRRVPLEVDMTPKTDEIQEVVDASPKNLVCNVAVTYGRVPGLGCGHEGTLV